MYKRLLSLMTLVIVLMLISDVALATAPFYEGKVMQIVVGAPAGGGFDAYARLVARHMAKYIPGHPTIIVVNMPGAGFRIAANHLYSGRNSLGTQGLNSMRRNTSTLAPLRRRKMSLS